jgi:excisionase family DNA binding protein
MQGHIRVSRLARMADVSDETIRRLITAGKLSAIRVGCLYMIPESEAHRLLSGAFGRSRQHETAALTPAMETR